jgi:hypothetical protein
MSDVAIITHLIGNIYLGGPPLVKAATGKTIYQLCGSGNISSVSYMDVFVGLFKIFLSNRQVPVYQIEHLCEIVMNLC